MTPIYGTHPADYLERAKVALNVGNGESFFYAALELRAGIESRLKDYVQESSYIPKAKKKEWKIANLSRTIEDHFQFQKKNLANPKEEVFQLLVIEIQSKKVVAEFNYFPVSKRAKDIAMILGDYLHSNYRQGKMDEPWWERFKNVVKEGILELECCLRGNLLGTPLMNYSTGQVEMILEHSGDEEIEYIQRLFSAQEKICIIVNHLDISTLKLPSTNVRPLSYIPRNMTTLKLSLDMHFIRPSDEEFAECQKFGELVALTSEGQEYLANINQFLWGKIQKVLQLCFPISSASVEKNGIYYFIAYISEEGYLFKPAIRPSTPASEHFVRVFVANTIFPPPPEIGKVANSGANWTRIPRQTGQPFQSKLDTDSTANWTVK